MKKILGWAVLAALVLWAVAFFALNQMHARETQSMVAAADRVDIPGNWTLISERIESEKLPCLNSNPCPSLHRRWQTSEELSEDSLQVLASSAGLSLTVDRSCARPDNVLGDAALCTGTAADDGYDFSFTISSPQPGADSILVLGVEASDE
ncbi:hypothetical protein GC088_04495 [Arthrobacter sp. JZ12]|uniref:hypothetical protein n=1 Tax=Arthrobacter sp. JZ12 TaxID=2654190 RepID=UPI002B478E9D|nr:hypothetical protein [Arthrobacter sp. JZ12]WRH24417.1 hypothetical protein GC088_04495 [Arthrobacter sp. JZ12]